MVVSVMGSSILSEVARTSILRKGLPAPLLLFSQLVTDPSIEHPPQRAGAQRLLCCGPSRSEASGHYPSIPEIDDASASQRPHRVRVAECPVTEV